jgi:hypothetical protein
MHDTLKNIYQNLGENLERNLKLVRPRSAWESNTKTRNEDAESFLIGLK